MRRCPNCDKNTAANIFTVLERGNDGKTFSHYRRRFKCKTCGHIFTTYEFYIEPDVKTNLLRLARLGREFIEFKVRWKEAVQAELKKRAEISKEYKAEMRKLKEDKNLKAKEISTEEDYLELLKLEDFIKGEEDDE